MRVLGISAFYHDSAAALVEDGRIVAAAHEERFSRDKHDPGFPRAAAAWCIRQGGVPDCVAYYEKPFLKLERIIENHLAFAPRGFGAFAASMPVWTKEKAFMERTLRRELGLLIPGFRKSGTLLFTEHHLAHAASAFLASPFDEAAILTVDGVGEWATATAGTGRGGRIELTKEIRYPHSIGLLYSAFTAYLGFRVNEDEYKVMGLAPFGEPKYRDLILGKLMDLKSDGSFRLDHLYFGYLTGLTMVNGKFEALFGMATRKPGEPLTRAHMDLAASVQAVVEEAMVRMARALARETGIENLCLGGGVGLNCVANGRILRDGAFKRVWIQPAAGDAGGALGAALAACHVHGGMSRPPAGGRDSMQGSLLGPEFPQADIEARLTALGAKYEVMPRESLLKAVARDIASGKVVGWFQGRMEFGPRALGARSILADARSPVMRDTVNMKVKHREGFRPFAPAVLREEAREWFETGGDGDSPYMLLAGSVNARHLKKLSADDGKLEGFDKLKAVRSDIPAVTHVDNSARVQTVDAAVNPGFHALISAFRDLTGCPVVLNTSFNDADEPIVCTPEDAYRCFLKTGLDSLAIGECYVTREETAASRQT